MIEKNRGSRFFFCDGSLAERFKNSKMHKIFSRITNPEALPSNAPLL